MSECTKAERQLLDAVRDGKNIEEAKNLINLAHAKENMHVVEELRALRKQRRALISEEHDALKNKLRLPFPGPCINAAYTFIYGRDE